MAESILKLKVASEEYENKLKRASEGLQKYIEGCRKAGGTLEHLDDGVLDFVKALGSMETKSTSARGKISELRKGFIDMKAEYLHMTEAEKNGDIGKALSASLDQMKTRFHVAKNELAEINKELSGNKFGQFGSVIDTIGSKLGVTGNLTEMLTSQTALLTGAVGAGIAVVTKATEAWANYNAELAKQDQITQVTTGLKGEDADRMTDKMRALSDTYNVDFREAVNAANTLMSQFGMTGDQSIQLLRDGMQGMIMGDGQKLLNMIQSYAPAFRDAGISASQLVAIIQNSEGGIFTDQNMNAIVMGIKNIRLMTDATSQALAKMGIDGQKMSKQLSDGSLTIFDALKQVSRQLQTVDSNSKTAGEVMQQVFGRQGVTAGTNLAKAIETLNTDLEQTKKQTGEVGDALADLQTANEKLNTAIREAFSYDGWDQMANGIKANLIKALATVIEQLGKIRNFFDSFRVGNVTNSSEVEKQLKKLKASKTSGSSYYTTFAYNDQVEKYNRNINGLDAYIKQYDQNHSSVNTVLQKASKEYGQKFGSIEDLRDLRNAYNQSLADYKKGALAILSEPPKTNHTDNNNPHHIGGNKTTTTTGIKDEFTDMEELVGLIPVAEQKVKDLQQQIRESWDQNEIVKLNEKLKDAQNELDVLQGKLPKDTVVDITVDAKTADALQKIGDIEGVTIDTKTMTVTADTTEALQRVQKLVADMNGTIIEMKVVPQVTDEDIERSLRQQYGKPIEVPITPMTAGEALEQEVRVKLAKQNVEADMQTLRTLMETQIKNGIEGVDIPADWIADQIFGEGMDIPDETWQALQDQINEKLRELQIDPIKIDFKTGNIEKQAKQMTEDWKSAASAIQSVGSAMAQIEDPMTKVIGTIAQAVATMALSYAQAAASPAVTGSGWGWIAFAATGVSTMLSSIAAIKQATAGFYAEGGIVPGNNHNDGLLAHVSSGELILNRAQQNSIASQLEGGMSLPQNIQLETRVDAEELIIMLNNNGMRRGLGRFING